MPDNGSRAAEIRTEAIERLARAEFEKDRELIVINNRPPWNEASEAERAEYRDIVAHLADALGDLLPTDTEEALAGGFQLGIHTMKDIENQSFPPVRTMRRYVTDWTEVTGG